MENNSYEELQVTGRLAAAETMWRSVHAEFGLLTAQELSAVLDTTPDAVRGLYAAGKLAAVHRGGRVLYPGFQVDAAARRVLPVAGELLRTAETAGRTEAALILWLITPDAALDGARPVDLLDDRYRILAAAKEAFTAST